MQIELVENDEGVICSFSSLSGRAEFKKSLSTVPFNRRFYQDQNKGWFSRGCIGFDSFDDLIADLKRIRRSTGSKKLITIGTSMGGFAALTLGAIAQADQAIAFDPQTSINKDWRSSVGDKRWSEEMSRISPDIDDFLPLSGELKSLILFGQDVSIDAIHALRLSEIDNVCLLGIDYSAHNSALRLARRHQLDGLLASVFSDQPFQSARTSDLIDFGGWDGKKDDLIAYELFGAKHRKEDLRSLSKSAIEALPAWAFPHIEMAMIEVSQKNFERAKQHLERAIELCPNYSEAHIQIGKLLLRINHIEVAEQHLKLASKLTPTRAAAHYFLAVCLEKQGNFAAAREAVQKAVDISPQWNSAHELLARVQ